MSRLRARNGFAARLEHILAVGLKTAGIDASIATEPVQGTRLHRVYVTAKKFANLRPTERQDLIWRIVGQSLGPDEQLRISMIYVVTPDELRDTHD